MRVPGIFYWIGMISPGRISDGLFDLADLFNTSLALSGAKDQMPTDRYIDGIDQTSFLLTDNGQSNRKYIYYWLGSNFSAVRVGEYKYMMAAESDDDRDNYLQGGFSGYIMNYYFGKAFNLYLDAKETHNFFLRKVIYSDIFLGPIRAHLATFQKYPPKDILGD
jgi:arylsulfatase